MRVHFLFFFVLLGSFSLAQSINDYQAVIVPLKFDFQKTTNEYRLSTLAKFNLNKAGFEVFYTQEPNSYDKCSLLYVDVINLKAFLATKIYFVLKDCTGKEIFKSEVGYSKEKEYQLAYTDALNDAFMSLYTKNYKYNPSSMVATTKANAIATTPTPVVAAIPVEVSNAVSGEMYYAQPIANGFQLVDTAPKLIMKLLKTSKSDCFIATRQGIQGVLILKGNEWFFEYYQNEQLFSEKMAIKF